MLTNDIGYADLTSKLNNSNKDSIVSILKKAKGFIFDLRGYPHDDFDVESLFDILTKNAKIPGGGKEIVAAPSSPNIHSNVDTRITTTYQEWSSNKTGWIYPGQVIVLTNESAQSAAEHFAATIKARSNATIIGSPTAGANGGVASFNIPGGITLHFSQLGLLLPNGKSFQRFGVQPDINIQPTIKGIQAGKDEVLERALKFLKTGK
jgi:C-terminal processing protease CtpA/Prc